VLNVLRLAVGLEPLHPLFLSAPTGLDPGTCRL